MPRGPTPERWRATGPCTVQGRCRACGGMAAAAGPASRESLTDASRTRRAALERTAFVFGKTAPHPGVLTGFQGKLEAYIHDLTTLAHSLGLLNLGDRRARVPNREKQLGIFREARSAVAPIHRHSLFPVHRARAVASVRWCQWPEGPSSGMNRRRIWRLAMRYTPVFFPPHGPRTRSLGGALRGSSHTAPPPCRTAPRARAVI